jgi:hypothetical protein
VSDVRVAKVWDRWPPQTTGEQECADLQQGLEVAPKSPPPFQGGLSNDELRAAWQLKLPSVKPTDRDLSAFALGIEVGHDQGEMPHD